MFDVNKIITALQTDPNAQRTALAGGGGLAAGFAASMLMGKKGRKMMGTAAKYGAVAAIGGIAYHAWQKSQQNKQVRAPLRLRPLPGTPLSHPRRKTPPSCPPRRMRLRSISWARRSSAR